MKPLGHCRGGLRVTRIESRIRMQGKPAAWNVLAAQVL